jgi:hypothetical protein
MTISKALQSTENLAPETIAALRFGIALLDPNNPDGIAGWREVVSPDDVAAVLAVDDKTVRALYQGRKTWKEDERTRLAQYLSERRARLTEPDEEVP